MRHCWDELFFEDLTGVAAYGSFLVCLFQIVDADYLYGFLLIETLSSAQRMNDTLIVPVA